ncbi:MAG: helix-turn-helix transcriptional regulator [Clostridia bacterium]|nr:helix-turn-helix transcriptional regulator [Clostridia bacterium]
MDWIQTINNTIKLVDSHLKDKYILQLLSKEMYISTSHLQKGFKAITGVTISEYFSSRKLYSAALDIVGGVDSFLEISYRYQYESYDAFFKAFKNSMVILLQK